MRFSYVIGVDINDAKLRVAKDRIRMHQLNAELTRSDGAYLPFRIGSFDKIICIDVLHIPRNYRQVITEMLRVLKVGGTLTATFMNKNFPPFRNLEA